MPDLIRTGGGSFDPEDRYIYFLASNVERMTHGAVVYDHLLVAVNEINTERERDALEGWIDEGKRVFLDSGIFNLAMEHARRNRVSHDVALNLAPTEIDGFQPLFERYVALVEQYGDSLWGYIELDQGGRDNKIKTRARLEDMGLRPIPVYHPFGDGWDYFDYLAERYDRICLGNIVQASPATRLRLLATIHERKRKYPHLWIHTLGLTPNEVAFTYPTESADSSSWLSAVRWSGYNERTCGATLGPTGPRFQYRLGSDPYAEHGSRKGTRMAAYGAALGMMNWRHFQQEYHNADNA